MDSFNLYIIGPHCSGGGELSETSEERWILMRDLKEGTEKVSWEALDTVSLTCKLSFLVYTCGFPR